MKTKHKQVNVWNPEFNEMVAIDEEIVNLISLLWHKFGIMTALSCQDNNGVIWIMFPLIGDLEMFLDALTICRDEDLDLYNEIMEEWQYDTGPEDLAENIDYEKDEVYLEGPSNIIFGGSVRFPMCDLDRVVGVLENVAWHEKEQ